MARTNIVLDDALVRKAMKLTGAKTKRQLVDIALRKLIEQEDEILKRRALNARILKLRGKLHWEGNLDEMRRSRV